MRDDLARHLAEHDIDWREDDRDWLSSEAQLDERIVETPHLTSEKVYWSALHEIAHIVLELHTYNADGSVNEDNEVAAWQWALEVAVITPGDEGRESIHMSLASHGISGILERLEDSLPEAEGPMQFLDRPSD